MQPAREEALRLAKGLPPTPAAIGRVAKATTDEAAQWAFTQWGLRSRGAVKFEKAASMLFDREGLEMASHQSVAAFHATHFPEGVRVADLTCGIGADLIALASRGPSVGYETHSERAAMARHNTALHGLAVDIFDDDGMGDAVDAEYIFVDPARRSGQKRNLDPGGFSPPLPRVVARLERATQGVVKLSPLLPDSVLSGIGGRITMVSFEWECREALVVVGSGAGPVEAVKVETGERVGYTPLAAVLDEPLNWILEADPASIRAHALGAFGLAGLGSSPGYLTSASPVRSSWLRSYAVTWHGPFRERAIEMELRRHSARLTAVKTRGVSLDPRTVERKFQGFGSTPLILVLYRAGPQVCAALVSREEP